MRRWLVRLGKVFAVLTTLLVLFLAVVVVDGWRAFGQQATGERLARMTRSPEYRDGEFRNPEPLRNDTWLMLKGFWNRSDHARPATPIPVVARQRQDFAAPQALRVTWFGHSSILVEIDGRRVLTDPVWGERTSPLTWLGPKRFYAPPIALAELPTPDVVLISHDHYDHLDEPTITAMRGWDTTFVVPLGVGAHLAYWGVPEARIVELDWWQAFERGELRIVATPARHASGRTVYDQNETLWAGYAILTDRHRVYFSGDTGLFPAMADIGARLGPFDITMIESGAYDPAWPDWHIGPEQAVRAHGMVGGKLMIPIHWGLFDLAYHGWTEPVERVVREAERRGARVVVPRPGQSVDPSTPLERWWPTVPFDSAVAKPIVSSQVPPEPAL